MKISGSYLVPAARERTYQLLQDPEILAKCMPGTDQLNKVGSDEYEMKMKMAIASTTAPASAGSQMGARNGRLCRVITGGSMAP